MTSVSNALGVAKATLNEAELDSIAIYLLDPEVYVEGTEIRVGRQRTPITMSCLVMFIDRVPDANWAHAARYVLVPDDAGGEAVVVDGDHLPPPVEHLYLVYRGNKVRDWMMLTSREPPS